MTRNKHTHERGAISGLQVTVIGLAVLVLGLGSFGIWSFVSYQDAQSNVDSKIDVAVANGKKDQADEDEQKFRDVSKQPWDQGKFHQPRKFGAFPSRRPEFWLETVLVDEDLNQRPAVKEAWDHFQVLAGLTDINLDREYR
mgnify:CR=1 FL=1